MSYYRQASISFGPPMRPMVKKLIFFTTAVFLLTYPPTLIFHWAWPFEWLGLRPYDLLHKFNFWQPVTYLFLHWGWFHVIFNLFGLWMFGSDLEGLWGSRQFLFFFFLTGVGSALFSVFLQPSSHIPTVGNSGVIFGLLLAYGLTFPDRPILLWLIIPIKAKWFAAIFGLIEFVSSLSDPGSGVSHVAHLGGMLFAFLYLRGAGLPYRLQLRYQEWRRARLRKKFELFMREQEKKNSAGRWVN